MSKLTKEDIELFNFIINDPQSTESEKKSAKDVLKQFGASEEKTPTKKTPTKRASTKKTPTKKVFTDEEKAEMEILKKTGKTQEECEKIVEQYKALKSKEVVTEKKQTAKKKQDKKRTTKLKKQGKTIKGTTEKNVEATLDTATEKVVKKIDKEVESIEKTSTTKKQVEKKISSLVSKAVRSNKKLLSDTAKELAKVDKNNAKAYLMSLRKEIDSLLTKYEYGGTLPSSFGQAGLVGETGAMNEMDLFAMGGGLPQGVHQYYAQTYNPAYPTPHGYAKGGYVYREYDYYATEFLNKKEVMELIEKNNESFGTNYKTIESFNKGEQKENGIRSIEKMAKGGMTTSDKHAKIIADLEKIQSEVTDRPPYVYERDGQLFVSSEEGDEFSDYDGEYYEPMYIDERLEAIAEKNGGYWDWENAGSIVFVDDSFAKGGKVRSTENNLRTFFTFDGEDFAILGGHLYGATEGDNEFSLIDNINYAPKEVQVAYYEKMRGFEKGGEVIDTFTSIQGSKVMPNNPFTIEKENEFYVIKNSKGEVLAKDTTKDGIMNDKGIFLNLYAKGGKTKRSKHSYMQDRRRISKEPWEVAYQKRKNSK